MRRLARTRTAKNQGCHGRTLSCAIVEYRWSHDSSPVFADQPAAEEWLGEHWQTLINKGTNEVTLLCDDEVVYGPMSLHPAD
jgi:hypothetical protein